MSDLQGISALSAGRRQETPDAGDRLQISRSRAINGHKSNSLRLGVVAKAEFDIRECFGQDHPVEVPT
jgi:hypothetical protein